MKTMPEIMLATGRPAATKPRLPKHWSVRSVTFKTLVKAGELAPITIVDSLNPVVLANDIEFTSALAERFEESSPSNFLVLTFAQPAKIKPELKVKLLKPFAHPERVEINEDIGAVPELLESLAAKIQVLNERQTSETLPPPRSSPLDEIKAVVSATGDLRVENGNLSAAKIVRLFGLSLNALAQIMGRSRQALTKTPDADSLQTDLSYFERIARLRTVLAGDSEFRKWLRMPHPDLNGQTPLRWIERKRWQALADFVEDMLTGSPA